MLVPLKNKNSPRQMHTPVGCDSDSNSAPLGVGLNHIGIGVNKMDKKMYVVHCLKRMDYYQDRSMQQKIT